MVKVLKNSMAYHILNLGLGPDRSIQNFQRLW